MTRFTTVRPNQRRVRAEINAWAKSDKSSTVRLTKISPEKSAEISCSFTEAIISRKHLDGDLEIA
ncbi:hypothetical protein [Pantoea cypripedii]|uniref:hypothetical protein n=1 Tax=Pantoea cypripedii TaxID=55209 RepID=UPI001ABF608F|nr:hypothetical protein [Pantoea cypripedii]